MQWLSNITNTEWLGLFDDFKKNLHTAFLIEREWNILLQIKYFHETFPLPQDIIHFSCKIKIFLPLTHLGMTALIHYQMSFHPGCSGKWIIKTKN